MAHRQRAEGQWEPVKCGAFFIFSPRSVSTVGCLQTRTCRSAGTESTCVCAPALLHSAWLSWRKPSGVPAVAEPPLLRLCTCSQRVRARSQWRCARAGLCKDAPLCTASTCSLHLSSGRAEACQASTWRSALRLTLHCIVAERATGSSRPRSCGRLKCAQRLCLL